MIARILTAIAALAASSCGGGRPADSPDELVVGMALEPPNLDPTAAAAAATDEVVYANVFEGLTRIDENGDVRPALATSWTASPDGLSYAFRLRSDVRFHDGSAFDADDVKFSLERAGASQSTNAQRALFANVLRVDTPSPGEAIVRLSRAIPEFPRYLGWGDAVMVAPETAATNAQRPVGTGPFRFSEQRPGEQIRLTRNEDYWGERPALSAITFRIISDSAAAYGALMAGDVDGFPNFPSPQMIRQIEKNPRFRVTVGRTMGETVLGLNASRAPFDQYEVRRAISLAVNRKDVIDGAMFGAGTPISTFYPPGLSDSIDAFSLSPYAPEKARQLLADAGLGAGFSVKLAAPPTEYARRSAEIIRAQLAQIGVRVEIEPIEWAQWLSQVLVNRNYDMTIVSHTEPDDLDFFSRKPNYFGYDRQEFDVAVSAMRGAGTPADRARWSAAAQRMLAEDAAAVFLFELPQVGVWKRSVTGVWENAPIQANDFTQAKKTASP
jgi:peptide/nickel transport system substrate-binding protein